MQARKALTWNLRTSAPLYANRNQASIPIPIPAAMLDTVTARLAKVSTPKIASGEKPNTAVSSLSRTNVIGNHFEKQVSNMLCSLSIGVG